MTQTELRPAASQVDLDALDAWWRAANYLSVGQIYLLDNPLLTEPLRPEHVKPLDASITYLFLHSGGGNW